MIVFFNKFKIKIIESFTYLYIIVLGSNNNIIYRDTIIGAMNPNEIIYKIDKISKLAKIVNLSLFLLILSFKYLMIIYLI